MMFIVGGPRNCRKLATLGISILPFLCACREAGKPVSLAAFGDEVEASERRELEKLPGRFPVSNGRVTTRVDTALGRGEKVAEFVRESGAQNVEPNGDSVIADVPVTSLRAIARHGDVLRIERFVRERRSHRDPPSCVELRRRAKAEKERRARERALVAGRAVENEPLEPDDRLDECAIAVGMAAVRDRTSACLAGPQGPEGMILLVTFAPDGRVLGAAPKHPSPNTARAADCVARVVMDARVDPFKGGAVTQTVRFVR
jgi:hypothetical protein